jgi:hypothetical protein
VLSRITNQLIYDHRLLLLRLLLLLLLLLDDTRRKADCSWQRNQ